MEIEVMDNTEMADPSTKPTKKRKRKDREEESKVDEIESRYMDKVYSKISKIQTADTPTHESLTTAVTTITAPQTTNQDEEIDPELLQHETLTPNSDAAEKTLFLSNVPVKVLTSKPLLKSLKQLFSTHGHIAFSEGGPRKLAFVTKKLHSERDSLNSYIVYEKAESVNSAVRDLNGYLWEGKHLRVDSVSQPTVLTLPWMFSSSTFADDRRTIINDRCLWGIYLSMFKMKIYIPTLPDVEKLNS